MCMSAGVPGGWSSATCRPEGCGPAEGLATPEATHLPLIRAHRGSYLGESWSSHRRGIIELSYQVSVSAYVCVVRICPPRVSVDGCVSGFPTGGGVVRRGSTHGGAETQQRGARAQISEGSTHTGFEGARGVIVFTAFSL